MLHLIMDLPEINKKIMRGSTLHINRETKIEALLLHNLTLESLGFFTLIQFRKKNKFKYP